MMEVFFWLFLFGLGVTAGVLFERTAQVRKPTPVTAPPAPIDLTPAQAQAAELERCLERALTRLDSLEQRIEALPKTTAPMLFSSACSWPLASVPVGKKKKPPQS